MEKNNKIYSEQNELDFSSVLSETRIGIEENKTDNFSYNDTTTHETVLLSSSKLFITTSAASSESLVGDTSYNNTQYYIIGIYAFFVGVFLLGIFIVVAIKLYKACCIKYLDDDEYDSMPEENLNVLDNPILEHHVNVDPTDVVTHQGHDSDYDYYSDVSDGHPDDVKEKPPDYEGPPSYNTVLQTSMQA